MAFVHEVLGVLGEWATVGDAKDVALVAVAALMIYMVGLLLTRIGKKRFLGTHSVFDLLLAFILGSVLSRAINGGASLAGTALAGGVLIGIHWTFSLLASRSSRFGLVVKGGSSPLVLEGRLLEERMRHHHITQNDLRQAAHREGLHDLAGVDAAYLERNGQISIIPKFRSTVVDVDVREGVQTVRIEVQV